MRIDRKIRTFMELCARGFVSDEFQMWTARQVGAGARTEVKLVDFRNSDYEFSEVYSDSIDDEGFFDKLNMDVDEDFNMYLFIGPGSFDTGTIYKYSYATGNQVWSAGFGTTYDGLTWWDGQVYALNYLGNDIRVLDDSDGQTLDTIDTPQNFDAGSTGQFRLEDESIYYCITPSGVFTLEALDLASGSFTDYTPPFPSGEPDSVSEAQKTYRVDYAGNHYCIYKKSGEGGAMIKWDGDFNILWNIDINYGGNDAHTIEVDLNGDVYYGTITGQTSRLAKLATDDDGLNPSQAWIVDIHTSLTLNPAISIIQAERSASGRVFTGHEVAGNIRSVRKSDGGGLIAHGLTITPTAMIILPGLTNKLGE